MSLPQAHPADRGTISIRGSGAGAIFCTPTYAPANSTQGQKRFSGRSRAAVFNRHDDFRLTAARWDGDTGGILAFDVAGALNLNSATVNSPAWAFAAAALANS